MRFIELFAGIGGMGYGLMQAGMECVGYCEIDKYAHQAYQLLHDPEERMWNAYDVRSVTDDDIRRLGSERGPIQLIAGGFPCQSFSIAGKREGFEDTTRGTLFFEIIRFASILRPEYLLLENVDGLRNHDNGRTLGTILSALHELGYDAEWQVLNSAGWVPQNRERIFIVASLGGKCTGKVFPFGGENSNAIEVVGSLERKHEQNGRVYGVHGIVPTLSTGHGDAVTKVIVNNGKLEVGGEVATCIDANYHKGFDNHAQRTGVLSLTRQFKGKYGVGVDVVGTLQSSRVDKVPMVVEEPRAVLTPDRMEKQQNGRRMKEPGEPMFTLTAQDLHGVAIIDDQGRTTKQNKLLDTVPTLRAQSHGNEPKVYNGYHIRKLTPLECFRLQSYPDWWYVELKLYRHPELIPLVDMSRNDITAQVLGLIAEHGIKEGISDSQLYKQAGNGVTSVVAYEIGRRINL